MRVPDLQEPAVTCVYQVGEDSGALRVSLGSRTSRILPAL